MQMARAWVMLLLGIVLVWEVPTYAGQWERVRHDNAKAIVYLIATTKHDNGAEATETGTGFIIHPDGFVLTCHHLVAQTENVLGAAGGKDEPRFRLRVIERDPAHDLALLRFERDNFEWPTVAVEVIRAAPELNVYVLGYPQPLGLTGAAGTIISVTADRWITSAATNHGHSGAPVFDESGNVIGIADAGYALRQQMNTVIPLSFAAPLLLRAGVGLDTAIAPQSDRSSSLTPQPKSAPTAAGTEKAVARHGGEDREPAAGGISSRGVIAALGTTTEGYRVQAIQALVSGGGVTGPISAEDAKGILTGTTGASRAQAIRHLAPLLKQGLSGQESATILGSAADLSEGYRADAVQTLATTHRFGQNG